MSEKQERFSRMGDGISIVESIIRDRDIGNDWYMGVDYDIVNNPGTQDMGTKRVPMSRIALLTESGLLPASMLPHTVTSMVEGDMQYDSATKQWTFTASNGDVYGCPKPAGKTPDESVVYVDNTPSGEDYYQYMFVPAKTPTETDIGTFYCLPSPYMLVDGNATHIHDDPDEYTRTVNIVTAKSDTLSSDIEDKSTAIQVITDPETGATVLTHTLYSNKEQVAGVDVAQAPKFGEEFSVPYIVANNSGHVTTALTSTVTMPATPASATDAGLVVIGTEDPQPVGTVAAPGSSTITIGEVTYPLVAAANHVHTAKTFTIKNDGNGSTTTYNGSADVTFDLNSLVGANLPSAEPTEDSVLMYDGNSLVWTPATDIVTVHFAMAHGRARTVSDNSSTATFGDLTVDSSVGGLGVSGEYFTGLLAGHVYTVSFVIALHNDGPVAYYENSSVRGYNGAAGIAGTNVYFNVDGSRTGTQYVNGSYTFKHTDATGNAGKHRIELNSDTAGVFEHGKWEATLVQCQIAELK